MMCRLIWLALLAGGVGFAHAQSVAAGERKHGICASCHGIDGRSFNIHYPILAGQSAPYLMRQVAQTLTDADSDDLGNYFAGIR